MLVVFALVKPSQAEGPEPTEKDVGYLAADRTERLDVWLPAPEVPRPLPCVIVIHGGGWRSGDKGIKAYREVAAELAARSYAAISINYLLNESITGADGKVRHTRSAWPVNFADCEAALRWVRTVGAAKYGIDPTRIAVLGGSAGGHLAMLLGSRHPEEIRAIVSLYGFGRIEGRWATAFAGRDESDTAVRIEEASPIRYFGPKSPPLFMTHGAADTTLAVDHARRLAQELDHRGARYVYVEIAGAPHGYYLQTELTDLRPALFAFLERHLAHLP
jgi:acetyl esterase/lipase